MEDPEVGSRGGAWSGASVIVVLRDHVASPLVPDGAGPLNASRSIDVDLRPNRDVFVQPRDVRVSEPDAAVGGARADGGTIRCPMQQEPIAKYQAIRSELTADLALPGVERWHEQRAV